MYMNFIKASSENRVSLWLFGDNQLYKERPGATSLFFAGSAFAENSLRSTVFADALSKKNGRWSRPFRGSDDSGAFY